LNGGGKFILLINVCIENNVFFGIPLRPSRPVMTSPNQFWLVTQISEGRHNH